MVGGAGGWSTAARQPQPERCQLWRRRPLAARSGATARTSTQSAARGAALRRHGWHGHARCGACAGYGSSFFQVKSAYLTAKTPKISRLARRARGALRRLARLRRAGSQVYSFSDIGSKCFTYSEHHSGRVLNLIRPTDRDSGTLAASPVGPPSRSWSASPARGRPRPPSATCPCAARVAVRRVQCVGCRSERRDCFVAAPVMKVGVGPSVHFFVV